MSESDVRPTPNPPLSSAAAPVARIIGGDYNDNGPGPEVMAAETLTGDPVVDTQGQELGHVTDIMVDVRRGRVAYAVLSSGGFLGIGDKLFAIPWGALTLDADRKCFVLDVDKGRLEAAPGFDKDHWPSMGDEQWAAEVHANHLSLHSVIVCKSPLKSSISVLLFVISCSSRHLLLVKCFA